jgi:hypothetical protein
VTHLRRIMGRNSSLVITLRLPYGITLPRSKPSLGISNALLIAWAPQHTREYQARLFAKRKLSPGTVTNHLCALRFFSIPDAEKTMECCRHSLSEKRLIAFPRFSVRKKFRTPVA